MARARLLIVDNYDSFTFMLADYFKSAGAAVAVMRSDRISVSEAIASDAHGLVVSPGPGTPEEAGISVGLAAACVAAGRPFLGVCLGHQALALACGGSVGRTPPVHGKTAKVTHDGSGLFAGLPSPVEMTRYHSLAATDVPADLVANAWSDDGTIMGLRHASAPAHGVQFHPESVASEYGHDLVRAFVDLAARA